MTSSTLKDEKVSGKIHEHQPSTTSSNMARSYTLLDSHGQPVRSDTPGNYAGWNGGRQDRKIFGTLNCASGARQIAPEHRVFFADLETAVRAGYRPCRKCKPVNEEEFQMLKRHIGYETLPERTLDEFYKR